MMSPRKWHAYRLEERPVEVSLVTASRLAELTATAADETEEPQRLSREEALWLFDRRCQEPSMALRSFLIDSGWGPHLAPLVDRRLLSLLREEISAGAFVAIRLANRLKEERKRDIATHPSAEAAPAPAPVPIRRAPPPAPEPDESEDPEFMCPAAQAEALAAAAASGIPFCAECQRAAAARAAAAR